MMNNNKICELKMKNYRPPPCFIGTRFFRFFALWFNISPRITYLKKKKKVVKIPQYQRKTVFFTPFFGYIHTFFIKIKKSGSVSLEPLPWVSAVPNFIEFRFLTLRYRTLRYHTHVRTRPKAHSSRSKIQGPIKRHLNQFFVKRIEDALGRFWQCMSFTKEKVYYEQCNLEFVWKDY